MQNLADIAETPCLSRSSYDGAFNRAAKSIAMQQCLSADQLPSFTKHFVVSTQVTAVTRITPVMKPVVTRYFGQRPSLGTLHALCHLCRFWLAESFVLPTVRPNWLH